MRQQLVLGTTVESAAEAVRNLGFVVTPEMLTVLAQEVGESSILSRTGGAPTFAIGMAHIISEIFNSRACDGILVSLCDFI